MADPTKTNAWQKLKRLFERKKNDSIMDYFRSDSRRIDNFTIDSIGIYFDYSKNRIDTEVFNALLDLATEMNVEESIKAMFSGEKINFTENRAVLHTALRSSNSNEISIDGKSVKDMVLEELNKFGNFADKIYKEELQGHSGKIIDTVINIGIGGSHLGNEMVVNALENYSNTNVRIEFISNVDPANIYEVLKRCNPEKTMVIVASKTFTTKETISNALEVRNWINNHFNSEKSISKHFVAVTTNVQEAMYFGITSENIFKFWDFVGGRYSIWSSIGTVIACKIGFENFKLMLSGANEIDNHFRTSPIEKNIPIIMALIAIWYNNFYSCESHAVIPYQNYLDKFVPYLQQCSMESNGKRVNKSNEIIDNYSTGEIIWGDIGTNSQHAFFQLIHQGTRLIPVDFIGFKNTANERMNKDMHTTLYSNMVAQSEALMKGKDYSEALEELLAKGYEKTDASELATHKVMPGNRPSNLIVFDILDPENLGKLIAIYEHKIFVQGLIWGINSFDQWGVELGKVMSEKINKEISENKPSTEHDASTLKLIEMYIQTNE